MTRDSDALNGNAGPNRGRVRLLRSVAVALAVCLFVAVRADAQSGRSCCAPKAPAGAKKTSVKGTSTKRTNTKGTSAKGAGADGVFDIGGMTVPDVMLVDQDGARVRFRDLIHGKVVAINFIFTTCATICPPMGANFARLKGLLGKRVGGEVAMISVSIDPLTDTPERLRAWRSKFDSGSGWTLLTGGKQEVEELLRGLKVFTPVKETHTPTILIGREGAKGWVRANGLAPAEKLAALVRKNLNTHAEAGRPDAPAAALAAVAFNAFTDTIDRDLHYFTDVELHDQYGKSLRLYSDLMKGKIVVINPFFIECTGTCPVMNAKMEELQAHVGDRLGRDVVFISITVDPENDTPEKLKAYADRFHAGPGWHFLSGSPENVRLALTKLGQYVAVREQHKTILVMGNLRTRLWKKVNGLATPEEIIKAFDGVVRDNG